MELWFTEKHTPAAGITLKCKKTLFSGRSEIQQIDVVETEDFGRMLLLDGLVMTTERDESFYHEMLVHPAMNVGSMPQGQALVIGGGDGGAVRELARYPSLEGIVLCEIDPMVVEVSQRYLPGISCALSGNERLEIIYKDGVEYVGQTSQRFDRIFVDSSDPIGAAEVLFTAGFYSRCYSALSENGIMVVQSESPVYHLSIMKQIKQALYQAGFSRVLFYTGPVPTYPGGYWSWALALKEDMKEIVAQQNLPPEQKQKLNFFTLEMIPGCFVLPAFVKRALVSRQT